MPTERGLSQKTTANHPRLSAMSWYSLVNGLGAQNYFHGSMSDLRCDDGALTADAIRLLTERK